MKYQINSFLTKNGFELLESENSSSFGDYNYMLRSKSYSLIFNCSKSMKSINIQKNEHEEFDFSLVISYIKNDLDYLKPRDFEEMVYFLKENLDKVNELFDSKYYSRTIIKLKDLENKRMKKMFPDIC